MPSGGIKPPVSEAELHGYVDGELDRERQEAVRAHLAAYPVDAARVETWQRQTEAIRAAFPPTEAAQLLRTSLLSPEKKGGLSSRPWRERGFTHLIVVAFVSGALLSGGIVLVVSRQNLSEGALLFPPAQTAMTVDEFQQRVQKLEPISPSDRRQKKTRETDDDPKTSRLDLIEQAFASLREFEAKAAGSFSPNEIGQGRGPAVPVMPALSAEGLNLAAIRAVPSGRGGKLCVLYDKPDGSNIVLCAGKALEPGETAARLISPFPAAAIHWRQNGAEYVLVGALPEASPRRLAGEARKQIEAFEGK
jgi:anti-sigma factor RsiW